MVWPTGQTVNVFSVDGRALVQLMEMERWSRHGRTMMLLRCNKSDVLARDKARRAEIERKRRR